MNRTLKHLAKAAYVNLLPAELCDPHVDLETARALFVEYVELVEIENHSFCNRICWFCPNVFIDRRSVNHLMTDTLFDKIVSELGAIDYRGTLVWSRYHEPLAHESVFDRVAAARKRLPRAMLAMVSNGDYLNASSLARLESAGMDRLMLDLYLPDGKEGSKTELERSLRIFLRRTGLEVEEVAPREYRLHGSAINITMGAPNYTKEQISTRAGLMVIPKLKTYRRRAVCLAPTRHVVVDYDGKGMLCCQTRADSSAHRDAVIGDLSRSDYGLFHLYRDLGTARRGLLAPGAKGGVCRSCDVSDDGPDRLGRHPGVASLLRSVPGVPDLFRRARRRQLRSRRFEG